jgi:protein associated with RNAse G/E
MGDGASSFATRCASVRLLCPGRWWTALFLAAPDEWEIYCDVVTPPRWMGPGKVTMIDLDLDVYRSRAGRRVELLDHDEFAAHRERYGYPADVVEHATAAARWLLDSLAHGAEPFTSHYGRWLDLV